MDADQFIGPLHKVGVGSDHHGRADFGFSRTWQHANYDVTGFQNDSSSSSASSRFSEAAVNSSRSASDQEPVGFVVRCPQRMVLNYLWELPFGKGKALFTSTPVVSQVLGGWKLAGISAFSDGFPIGITGGGSGRPNVIGNPVLPAKDQIVGDGKTAVTCRMEPIAWCRRATSCTSIPMPSRCRY